MDSFAGAERRQRTDDRSRQRAHPPLRVRVFSSSDLNRQGWPTASPCKIIDDLLDMSRIITGKFRVDPRAMDLIAVVRDALEVVRPSAVAKKVELAFEPEQPACLLVADPERLQQAIWNLLSNAVKFTDSGGRIDVMLQVVGSRVTLQVKDTGQGIEPEFLPFVFDRFRQADSSMTRRFGGLGLGLALVRNIVELHGGRVAASSPGRGAGASFSIELPVKAVVPTVTPAPDEPKQRAPAPQRALELQGVRVLIVDDEADARELIAAVLTQFGAEVETARSTAEAWERFQQFHPDVLVSDLGMPDEDGLSLIRRIRKLSVGAATPALALSAFAQENDRARALAAGFTAHVGKPVEPELLAASVSDLVMRG